MSNFFVKNKCMLGDGLPAVNANSTQDGSKRGNWYIKKGGSGVPEYFHPWQPPSTNEYDKAELVYESVNFTQG